MGNLIQSNISFTVNTDEPIGGFATKRTNSNIISAGKYDLRSKQNLIEDNDEMLSGGFSINVVDIDWNSAEVGNETIIKNTGDLLSWVKNSLDSKSDASNVYSKDEIDAALGQIESGGTGTIDPAVLNGYVTIETYNALLQRVAALEQNAGSPEQQIEPFQYSIEFMNGEQIVKTVTGVTGTIVEAPTVTKEGYVFGGWSVNGEIVTPVTEIGEIDITYVAVWNEITYSVVFMNGEETVRTVTGAPGTVVEVPEVTREGYTFNGWSTDGETVIIPVANIGENNITYIAIWTEIRPEIAYGVSATMPTAATIKSIVDINAAKPEEPVQLNMTGSSVGPNQVQYFVYPLAWEESSDGEIIKPIVRDGNGFDTGFFADDDNPTLEVDGITYRICDIELGPTIYTITF